MQKFYRRRLPHLLRDGATYFVTFRLYGSIPMPIIKKLQEDLLQTEQEIGKLELPDEEKRRLVDKARKIQFWRYDHYLDKPLNGPYWLAKENVAAQVYESLLFFQSTFIDLHCFCIMSNHVHTLFTPLDSAPPLYNIMRRIKSYTGKYCNEMLTLNGKFWQRESYDHIVRDQLEFNNVVRYILNNPVKAGLVNRWKDWRWSWLSPKLLNTIK
jgi:putative transposase